MSEVAAPLFANQLGYTDINPFEVVRKVSERCMEIRAMDAEALPWERDFHIGGFFGHTSNQRDQKWSIKSCEANLVRRIRLHKDGRWYDSGKNRYRIDTKPVKFYDFNF